jgi:hypothetical protein
MQHIPLVEVRQRGHVPAQGRSTKTPTHRIVPGAIPSARFVSARLLTTVTIREAETQPVLQERHLTTEPQWMMLEVAHAQLTTGTTQAGHNAQRVTIGAPLAAAEQTLTASLVIPIPDHLPLPILLTVLQTQATMQIQPICQEAWVALI